MKAKNILSLVLCVLFTLCVGAVSGIATASGINGWFMALNKPFFNPPYYLFGPVWTALYILMGISFYMVLQAPASVDRKNAVAIFLVQLFLNFCWSFIFFRYQLVGWALVEIICIWLSIVTMIIIFSKINKTAAALQIPYLLWVTFASILNAAIWWLN